MSAALETVVPYATVPRLWPGETAVILGGGSSLTREDVHYCQGKARVIAIKEAIQLAPWADAMYACDERWWKYYRGAPEFKGLKYRLEHSTDESVPYAAWPDVQILRNTGTNGLETDPSGLRNGYNSGFQAINLAVHFGVSKIILLGFDCWTGPNGTQNWFGRHPIHIPSPYPLFLQAFSTIVEPLKEAGVEVLNASRFTVLTSFPRVTLEDVL